ncbi:ferric reductase [Heterobasidion irregulare TC 32-1]|uniref:ferric-chelate reductase (NADPH) n=1 Tax=Heterobasidion irregulare (strain TC 32-1) TaxID=747525 RepID=W4KDZ6_HETIT|nr:ferric reductase [Heterobasidion irregulare TC 32-1]ETW84033.1 ferric reductase [Heterobasidion irregulare TC 32-1]
MSLFEIFITLAYLAALLTWEFVHTNNLDPDFWSNKAAHLAAIQVPLLPALSSKNNVIGWLTGVSHEKLNVLHRSVARCILVLIWIHLWGRHRIGFTGADDLSVFHWERLGLAAGTIYTLTIILTLRPIRLLSHEVFYFTHIILVFAFVLLAYFHTLTPGFSYYIWPTWVVWGFERLFRLARYLTLNVFPRPSHSKARLSLISSDSLRLTLIRRIPLGWMPGQHVFLAFPTVSNVPLESHPFTIANIPKEGRGEQELVFIIRGREGLTKRLVERAAEKDGVKIPVFLDGPYGNPTNLRPYTTCVFIAGGSGVSYTLPLLLDLVKRVRDGTALAKRILFVWAIRDEEYLEWVAGLLADVISTVPPSLSIDIDLYVTGTSTQAKAASDLPLQEQATTTHTTREPSGSGEKTPESAEVGGLPSPRKGRPNVAQLVHGEINTAKGPTSVDVSGPPSLIKAVRDSLTSPISATRSVMNGGPTVHFHAENFTL